MPKNKVLDYSIETVSTVGIPKDAGMLENLTIGEMPKAQNLL
jgi:hypothetical protein